MKKIGVLFHPRKENAFPLAEKLKGYLVQKGISVWVCSAWETEEARRRINGTELILTVGGDGTILRAVQTIVPETVPITGINLGNLGFMTELSVEEVWGKLDRILEGEGWIDERALLEADVSGEGGQDTRRYFALNDVVLARGDMVRVIHVQAMIDGETLTTCKCDGMIIATATGSTGYALSANGPILHPQSREILLVPVAPHLSFGYTLVVADSAVISLRLNSVNPAALSIDGHISNTLMNGSVVTVRRSRCKLRFLRIGTENAFYSSLERKLKGKR